MKELWRRIRGKFPEKSEDTEQLLAPGNIEKLVKEGRIPVRMGRMGSSEATMRPYYSVPPPGFNPEVHTLVSNLFGVGTWADTEGKRLRGLTYTLSPEQEKELKKRVDDALRTAEGSKYRDEQV